MEIYEQRSSLKKFLHFRPSDLGNKKLCIAYLKVEIQKHPVLSKNLSYVSFKFPKSKIID